MVGLMQFHVIILPFFTGPLGSGQAGSGFLATVTAARGTVTAAHEITIRLDFSNLDSVAWDLLSTGLANST